jgi:ABC-2 type transport system ATP-binding protein
VDTEALARSFGDVHAVTDLTLRVPRGEMYCLVGPDGAGKSTAIRLLCGILRPTGGRGRILGHDLGEESERIKSKIGYLSQRFTLYGDLTVDENIEFFAALHGVAGYRARRDELIEFTRLTPFRRRLAHALSGGMKKKLALACTLIHTPEVIFLDEPSTGVDPVSRGEFWNILSGILEQGVTIFMTTPYLDEVERANRVGLMHRGAIIRTGAPSDVKRSMPGRIFHVECPRPLAASRALRARWPDAEIVQYGDHVRLWTERGPDFAEDMAAFLEESGLGPASFRSAEPTMEDVFAALLKQPVHSGGRM